jgi:hypothetical protein
VNQGQSNKKQNNYDGARIRVKDAMQFSSVLKFKMEKSVKLLKLNSFKLSPSHNKFFIIQNQNNSKNILKK